MTMYETDAMGGSMSTGMPSIKNGGLKQRGGVGCLVALPETGWDGLDWLGETDGEGWLVMHSSGCCGKGSEKWIRCSQRAEEGLLPISQGWGGGRKTVPVAGAELVCRWAFLGGRVHADGKIHQLPVGSRRSCSVSGSLPLWYQTMPVSELLA